MKRRILSMALCLSMIISMVVFAPATFAVADGESMATTEQTTLDATEDNTGDIAAPGDQETTPAPDEDAVTPAENQDADSAAAELQPGVTGANDSIKDTTDKTAQDADNNKTEILPPAVNFTDAGPFLPAVKVAASAIVKKAAKKVSTTGEKALTGEKDSTPEGLNLKKTATPNGDGTYKITLDAYTTGNVTTTTTTTPVDIVLVLDQSGSMNNKMKDGTTRQDALKQAVNGFIDGVKEKYSTEADHRIAIVDFRSDHKQVSKPYRYNAKIIKGWTDVDENGANSMKSTVSDMYAEGGTRTDAGMAEAVKLMTEGQGYYYNGSNKDRQKVVIVFTDGDPNGIDETSGFEMKVANAAIANAKTLKDAGCTVYSVGIFNGANPNEVYGGSGPNEPWKGQKKSLFANRFMNYMSSNYKSASSMHLKEDWISTGFFNGYYLYTPVNPPEKTGSNYYLTASDSTSLNNIFQTIVNNIGTPTIELGKETVVKDIVSDYFELPAGVTEKDIKLYTANAKADGSFESPVPATSDVKATINGKTVSVTGFDFNENFVSETAKSDGTYGKKLIIEFNVKVRDGFMGGNNVPTNGAASGIYKNASDNIPVGTFEVPTVDISLPEISVTAPEKNVYLFNKLEEKDFADAKKVTINGKVYTKEQFDALGWENDFVNLEFDNVVSGNEFGKLANDTNYIVRATLSPTTTGTATAKT
ncbi:MAG: VWA domain-containing protein, partial [Lachnospiraceae bacterium]|nr:VWA domain-containing protein [Lachnospiraceae bacterium]